jgi:phage terminase large subunit
MFIRTTAINKIKALTKFVKGVQGGTSAGKTYGILPIEIDYSCKHPMTETSIVSESIPHLKRGAMKDFKKIMKETGRWFDARWNATDFKYTFANGSEIEFFSADNDSKLRGARRDRLYINEANNVHFHAYTELASRTKQSITLDWNPVEDFWFHSDLINDDDVDFIIITYLDNEACPESALNFINKAKVKALTSSYWDNWYKVYGLGQLGTLDGVIFENYQLIDSIPDGAKLIGFGLDFGYSNDPTALIGVYDFDGKIICDEVIYSTSLLNSDIISMMLHDKRLPIWADSAEPKSIEEIRRAGFNIKAVVKGADSINFGISVLQQKDILITKSSVNLIKEFRSYSWDVDKVGKKLNKPIDSMNHGIDALRYFAMMALSIKKPRKIILG